MRGPRLTGGVTFLFPFPRSPESPRHLFSCHTPMVIRYYGAVV